MARTMSVSEARAGLPQILERVIEGEEVTITRHGKAVAVVVRPDVLRVRRAEGAWDTAVAVRDLLADAGARALASGPVLTMERAEELVEDVRASRADR
jgi:antitoxin (DNA-binding transcriptional repressor) of toxin-antitoxin stability system